MINENNIYTKIIGLIITPSETLEKRLAKILRYISDKYHELTIVVDGLDATGPIGSSLPEKFTTNGLSSIISVFEEDGQMIDFDMTIENADMAIQIKVIDNQDVDVLMSSRIILSEEITGNYNELKRY